MHVPARLVVASAFFNSKHHVFLQIVAKFSPLTLTFCIHKFFNLDLPVDQVYDISSRVWNYVQTKKLLIFQNLQMPGGSHYNIDF